MKIVRFLLQDKVRYGVLENDTIRGFKGSPFENRKDFKPDSSTYTASDVKLLAPCPPSKIVALGLNYRSHIEEMRLPKPDVPLIFLKPSTAVIGPDDCILIPETREKVHVDYEGEVGMVIGKKAKDVPEDQALDYVLGYTCVNDVSERIAQKKDGQWTRAKGYDTFAPIGPCIETEADPTNLQLQTYLNGQLRQSSSTSDLLFDMPFLIYFISGIMTLLPGDIISTGTAAGIGEVKPGDVVEIRIEGVGILRNCVALKSNT